MKKWLEVGFLGMFFSIMAYLVIFAISKAQGKSEGFGVLISLGIITPIVLILLGFLVGGLIGAVVERIGKD